MSTSFMQVAEKVIVRDFGITDKELFSLVLVVLDAFDDSKYLRKIQCEVLDRIEEEFE